MCRREPAPCPADAPASTTAIVAAAKKAGVIFMERVSDGELIVEGLDRLAPDDRQKLEAGWSDIRSLLLPNDTSTASIDLLTKLGIEPVYVDDRAARCCGGAADLRSRVHDWIGHRDCAVTAVSSESLAHSRNERR